MDRGFVITNERLHTGVGDVYAVGDIVPGLQLAHRGFQQGIFVAEEIAGPQPDRRRGRQHPQGHLLRAEVALRGLDRGAGGRQVRRGPGLVLRVQPGRQRQEPDPRDPGLDQGRPREGRLRSSAST